MGDTINTIFSFIRYLRGNNYNVTRFADVSFKCLKPLRAILKSVVLIPIGLLCYGLPPAFNLHVKVASFLQLYLFLYCLR